MTYIITNNTPKTNTVLKNNILEQTISVAQAVLVLLVETTILHSLMNYFANQNRNDSGRIQHFKTVLSNLNFGLGHPFRLSTYNRFSSS